MFRSWLKNLFLKLHHNAGTRGSVRRCRRRPPRPAARLLLETLEDRCLPSTVWFVNDAATGKNTGQNWGNAYTDLQSALHVAQAGDQIWVAKGTYAPTSGTDRTASFALDSGVALYGGFKGTETQLAQRDWAHNLTVLSGDIGTPGQTADNSYHVLTASNAGAGTALDGFTVSGGNANGPAGNDSYGGGLYDSSSTLSLANVRFTNNEAALQGGGLYDIDSTVAVSNALFFGNNAGSGGGIEDFRGSLTLQNVTLAYNTATAAPPALESTGTPTLADCVVWGNRSYSGNPVTQPVNASYSDLQDGQPGTGNVDADPLFVNGPAGDLHLRSGSPAIDAGTNAAAPAFDLDNNARPSGLADMGAFEVQKLPTSTSLVAADTQTTVYSTGSRTIQLKAAVSSPGGVVNEGTVTFSLQNPNSPQAILVPGIPVTNGQAVTTFDTAGLAAGTYSVHAQYVPGHAAYLGSDDAADAALTVKPDSTRTVVGPTFRIATASSLSQPVTFTATVTPGTAVPGGVVSEGTVTFTVLDANGHSVATLGGNPVVGGAARTAFDLAGLPAGNYTVHAAYVPAVRTSLLGSPVPNFSASADTTDSPFTLTTLVLLNLGQVSGTTTTVTSTGLTVNAANPQPVTLSAAVTSAGGVVNEGVVVFRIDDTQGNTVAGIPYIVSVSNGQATLSYTPSGLAPGSYRIHAVYTPPGVNANFAGSEDTTDGTLTVTAQSTTTTVTSTGLVAAFSADPQTVPVSASVTPGNPNAGVTVASGTVTFTLLDANRHAVGGSITVPNDGSGTFHGNLSLPGGTPTGTYFVRAVYTPAGAAFLASADASDGTLKIIPAGLVVAPGKGAVVLYFANVSQTIPVSATLYHAPGSSDTGTINEGTVTFSGFGTSVTAAVSGSKASAVFTVPASTPPGDYAIAFSYNPAATHPNYLAAAEPEGLGVQVLPDATTTTLPAGLSTPFSPNTQTVSLSASITPAPVQGFPTAAAVNEGTVAFAVLDGQGNLIAGATSGTVSGGKAAVNLVLPAGLAIGQYQIAASFNPPATGAHFSASVTLTHEALSVTPDSTIVVSTTPPATRPFTSSFESFTYSASVKSPTGRVVNEGFVTFEVQDETGRTVAGYLDIPVSGGVATYTPDLYTLPPAGTYHVRPVYIPARDNPTFAGSSDPVGSALVVTPDGTTTRLTTASQTRTFSTASQVVTFTASVVPSQLDKIFEGTATFTLLDANNHVVQAIPNISVNASTASAGFDLANVPAGNYHVHVTYVPAVSADHPTLDFAASSDAADVSLVVARDTTTTTVVSSGFVRTFSTGSQIVQLVAAVAPGDSGLGGVVNEGTVTFTVLNAAGNVVRTLTGNAVSGGKAVGQFDVANLPVGGYQIHAAYVPAAGRPSFTASSDARAGTLAIQQDGTVTELDGGDTFLYSATSQKIGLLGVITPQSGVRGGQVNEGTVTFTVLDASGKQVGTSVTSGTVARGFASVLYTLPAGTPVGTYHVLVSYNPAPVAPNFTASSILAGVGNSATNAEYVSWATTTRVTNTDLTRTFSTGTQPFTLTASVTSQLGGVVNEGTVMFFVSDANANTVFHGSSPVSGGSASLAMDLAGIPAGPYQINATYEDRSGFTFARSSDLTGQTLVLVRDTTTVNVTSSNLSQFFSTGDQTVQLSAAVVPGAAGQGGTVNEGTVTFSVLNSAGKVVTTVAGNAVANGMASGFLHLANLPAGAYKIHAAYVPAAAHPSFTASADTTDGTLTVLQDNTNLALTFTYQFASSVASQQVSLTAYINPTHYVPGGVVNEGTLTFTLRDGTGRQVAQGTSGTVQGGKATATLTLPAGTPAGNYVVDFAYNPAANNPSFVARTYPVSARAILRNPTTTKVTGAGVVNRTFSTASQLVPVSASVTSPTGGVVDEGTVSFYILDAAQNSVLQSDVAISGGGAGVKLDLSGLPAGTYQIGAFYLDNAGPKFAYSYDPAGEPLVIAKDSTTTALVTTTQTATFSSGVQKFEFIASVSPGNSAAGGTVNEGTVTFTLLNSAGAVVQTLPGNVVSQGTAGVALLSAHLPAGSYHVHATYVPAASGANFIGSSDARDGSLVIQPDGTTTAVTSTGLTGTFAGQQPVVLTATVANSKGGPVNEGTVTFTVLDANNRTVAASSGNAVSAGGASATLQLSNLPVGRYHLHAAYVPRTPVADYTASADTSDGTLQVVYGTTATVTSTNLGGSASAPVSQKVTLSATVTSGMGGVVNEGTVSFTVLDANGSLIPVGLPVPVFQGTASTTLDLAGLPAGTYRIHASYVPAGLNPLFGASTDGTDGILIIAPA